MNPFTLPGPQFLAFYLAFATAVLLVLYFGRRLRESGPQPRIELKDPYLFACLGDGPAQGHPRRERRARGSRAVEAERRYRRDGPA